jgi:hypothetical protein
VPKWIVQVTLLTGAGRLCVDREVKEVHIPSSVLKMDLHESARDRGRGAASHNVTFDMTRSWTRSGSC